MCVPFSLFNDCLLYISQHLKFILSFLVIFSAHYNERYITVAPPNKAKLYVRKQYSNILLIQGWLIQNNIQIESTVIPQSNRYGFLIKIVHLIQSRHYELFKVEIRSQEYLALLKR